MAYLIKASELALWTGNEIPVVAADPFAKEVMEKVSDMARFLSGQPDWVLDVGLDQIPFDARMIVLQVCKRTYENPRQVVQEGNVGPLGGDRVLDIAAMLMELTDYERATLTKYNLNGDPTPGPDSGVIYTVPTSRGEETILPQTSPIYIGDNQQVGLPASADPREWKIPLFNPGDPGDDANYL